MDGPRPRQSIDPRSFAKKHYPQAAELFAAIICGQLAAIDQVPDAESFDDLRYAADYHGVGPLVAHALSATSLETRKESALRDFFCPQKHADAALDLLRERELVRVLDVIDKHSIHPLLIKGTPLAYTHYPSPALRPRGDTDMLILEQDRESIQRLLKELGYDWDNAVSGVFISHQFTAEKRDEHGMEHALDVHWKLSNQQLFAELFSYEELAQTADPVAALGRNARTLSPIHALLFACCHRVGHFHAPYYIDDVPHYGGDRLIWLYDIHLLFNRMSDAELDAFVRLAATKNVKAVCLDGLEQAHYYFRTALPDYLIGALRADNEAEPSARYLAPGKLRHFLNEIRALPDWRDRATLLKEQAFPPADYILRKYDLSNRAWLPALYLYRGLLGAWKLVKG